MIRAFLFATVVGLILAALIATAAAKANLNTQYGTDADGNVEVPALSALATSVVGAPTRALCAVPQDDPVTRAPLYGWTYSYSISLDGGITWVTVWDTTIYIRGDICAELARLTEYGANKRLFARPKGVISWENDHTYNAAIALLTLVHESMHIKLQSDDEGIVECTAVRNLWPTLAALHLPSWLNRSLLEDAKDVHQQADDIYLAVC